MFVVEELTAFLVIAPLETSGGAQFWKKVTELRSIKLRHTCCAFIFKTPRFVFTNCKEGTGPEAKFWHLETDRCREISRVTNL